MQLETWLFASIVPNPKDSRCGFGACYIKVVASRSELRENLPFGVNFRFLAPVIWMGVYDGQLVAIISSGIDKTSLYEITHTERFW